MMSRSALATLLLVGALAPWPLGAQRSAADAALTAGRLARAESLYFRAARLRPRDPEARRDLGNYLAARGALRVGAVLLEEARMFGGDPGEIARLILPYYEDLNDWRALLTLPSSSLTMTQRRRAAWLSENSFAVASEGGAAHIIGTPRGDTIARVAVRVDGRAALAAIVSTDVRFMVGSRLTSTAHHFGNDSATVAFDSITVGQTKFVNVPASTGATASSLAIGVAAPGRLVVQIDYARDRLVMTRTDGGTADARYPLARFNGQLNVLDRGRWIPLGEFAASAARARSTLVIDFPSGEARMRK